MAVISMVGTTTITNLRKHQCQSGSGSLSVAILNNFNFIDAGPNSVLVAKLFIFRSWVQYFPTRREGVLLGDGVYERLLSSC